MTRFARSVGSKASNKREPESATPWNVMVNQMHKGRVDAGVEDDVDYDIGTMEEEPMENYQGTEREAESSESEVEDNEEIAANINAFKDVQDVKRKFSEVETEDLENVPKKVKSCLIEDDKQDTVSKKKKRNKNKNPKCKICGSKDHLKMDCEQLSEERRKELQELYQMKTERKGKGTGRKKNKKKDKNAVENIIDHDQLQARSEDSENTPKPKKNKKKKNQGKEEKPKIQGKEEKPNNQGKPTQKVNPYKIPLKDRTGQEVGEGEGLFHGFRVKKEDVKRLKKLYFDMKKKGIPRTEIDVLIKKERRNAENELARFKKKVCLNCRKEGHWLAQCPLASNDGIVQKSKNNEELKPNSGLCFKCGSLEHTSKECKSKLKGENAFRFAVCFICKEQGHLAKACPDNPKGLYPNGGGCVFCGSVEHLKADCVRKVEKDRKSTVWADTIGDNIEEERDFTDKKPTKKIKEKKKIITF